MLLALATALVLTQTPPAKRPPPAAGPTVAQQRLNAAQQAFQFAFTAHRQGSGGVEAVVLWSKRIAEAQKDTDHDAWKRHFERMTALEKTTLQKQKDGDTTALEVLTATWARAEAEQLVSKP